MNDIQVFNYDSRQVRTVEKNGEAWFVANDVCNVLGIRNSRQALKKLDADELMSLRVTSGGQMREVNGISEFGCYRLMMRSDKAEAKKFQRWLALDVLPAIRQKGYYAVPAVQSQIDALRGEIELLQAQNAGLKKYIQENSSFTMLRQAITPINLLL